MATLADLLNMPSGSTTSAPSGNRPFADPNAILNSGPHQGRGVWGSLVNSGDPNLSAIAQKFLSEQESAKQVDEGSTSYGDVPDAQQLASQAAQIIAQMPDDQYSQFTQVMALPPDQQQAFAAAQLYSGQSAQQQQQAQQTANALIGRLVQNGLDADTAVKLQQTALIARGDQLTNLVTQFQQLTGAIQSGLIQPAQVRQLGQNYADQVSQVVQEGKDIASEIPGIRDLAAQVGSSVDEITALGRQLGDASSPDFMARFNQRFQPILQQLQQQRTQDQQKIIEDQNARGVLGGTDTSYTQALYDYYNNLAANSGALQAQAQTEQQQLGEYQARAAAEPAARMTALSAGTTPFASLLELNAARLNDVSQLGNVATNAQQELQQGTNTEAQGVQAGTDTYNARTAEMNQANQRFGATYGTAIDQTAVPQSTRLQLGQQAGASTLGSELGYQGNVLQANTAKGIANTGQGYNILGGILGATGAGIGAYAASKSHPKFKENITPDPDNEKALHGFRKLMVYKWNYKDDPNKEQHTGGMTTEMPQEITTPDGESIDVISYLGELTKAVKALDEKVNGREYGNGFRSLVKA